MASYELTGSVTDKEKGFIETWENVSIVTNYIIRENRRGDEQYHQIKGPQKFKLSTYDRMLTEDKILDDRNNPFKNGSFRPVVVPEDVSIESNPNAMSNEDIARVFKASDVAWDEYMDVIDSPATIKRMIDMADNGEGELTHKRYRQIESMYERFSRNVNPRQGGMSEDEYKRLGSENEQPAAPRRGRPPKSA